jgi:dihydroorotase
MRYLIKNGSIIDPAARVATIGTILVENGKVMQVVDHAELGSAEIDIQGDDVQVINARGAVIAPGFIDLHSHTREPGDEAKETIASATRAAAAGGFTTICTMPDTNPTIDCAAVARQVREIGRRRGTIRVEAIGAITVDRQGVHLSEMAELVNAGCIGFSDNPRSVADAGLMRNALSYAAMLDVPVMVHCEDTRLSKGSAMHEGAISNRLGLPGVPAAAEDALIARDIALAELTGAHIHICTVSTAGGVALIRAARERGVRVTAEVTPHHLTLTDRWVLGNLAAGEVATTRKPGRAQRRAETGLGLPSWLDPARLHPYHTSTRLNPPLRSEDDCEALIEGLRDGTIDAIATDHAPHTPVEKDCEYRLAAPGIVGLETALGLAMTLVHRGKMDLVDLVAKLTEGPANVLGRSPATLRPGQHADIVIFDPDAHWTVEPGSFFSQGRSTPLAGQHLRGQVMLTMHRGEIVFRRDNFGVSGGSQHASRLEGILGDS